MSHVRQQIRDRFATLLTSGVSLVSSRVYSSRVYPLTQANLPALTIYTGSESSGLQTMGVKTLSRTASIMVDAYVRSTANVDDTIDSICVQVEEAIASDYTLNGIAKNTVLISTDIDFSGEAEQPVGIARLTFSVLYVTSINDVETAR